MKMKVSPQENLKAVGGVAWFKCEVDFNGTYEIRWSFEDGRLPANAEVRESNHLVITDIGPKNAGAYVCLTESRVGKTKTSGHLRVFSEFHKEQRMRLLLF